MTSFTLLPQNEENFEVYPRFLRSNSNSTKVVQKKKSKLGSQLGDLSLLSTSLFSKDANKGGFGLVLGTTRLPPVALNFYGPMFRNILISIDIPYACHYKRWFVYFLHTF